VVNAAIPDRLRMLFRFIVYSSGQCSARALARECLERWCGRTSDSNEDNFQIEIVPADDTSAANC
jgi:hypothetical protein